MGKMQRVGQVLIGLLAIACAVAMMLYPDVGYGLVMFILSASLVGTGIQRVWYYLTMARHMVGGKTVLYLGVFLFDLGILAGSLAGASHQFAMSYLFICHLLSGVIDILRAREQRKYGAPWKMTLALGLASVLIAICCMIYGASHAMVVYLYCGGLIYIACLRIASALRPTAIVYIP